MLSRGRFAVKVVVLEGPLDFFLKAFFVHFRVVLVSAWSSSCSSHMFGPKYPSYDSLGPSLGLSWAHVRPMPMLASVRTMLTHVAPRSGLG